jgi:1-hydroxy-2-isopentenylcarotenoid 3,4-desaturase
MRKAIIIGAGVGGLALANMLAKAGLQVTIYEQSSGPGGKAGRLDVEGFRFDTGPSWYLMPEVFEHYYELLGEDVNKQLELTRLEPGYRVTFEDGQQLTIRGDQKQDFQTFESIQAGSSHALGSYLEQAKRTYAIATKYFLYNNFDSYRNVINREVLSAGPAMATVARKTIHQNVQRYFHNQKLQQVLEYPAVFLGTSPFKAPAIYSLMSHLDFEQGVFYPQGGLYEIIRSLEGIGRKLGVTYVYNSSVTQVTTNNGAATGVVVGGKAVGADIVISNADLHFSETKLLPPKLQTYPEAYWKKRTAGPSAILLYLGIKGPLPTFEHHNLFFTADWEGSFSQIFQDKTWPDPASLYVCVPSKTDTTVAPKGYENMFVLIPGPAIDTLTQQQLDQLTEQYIAQLASMSHTPDLARRIVVKRAFGPADFSRQFNAWQGTALGLSHTLSQSAMFRPQNKSKKVKNLYYVGANTVPGIGIPMCLIGAELVYKRIIGNKTSGPLSVIVPA